MKIDVNNITISYSQEGKGESVLLLHGNGENRHIFDKLISKLKDNFTVYAIDSRNHGESSPTEEYNYDTMAEDIYQFIKKLNLHDVSVVGFSDGGIISLLLELKHKNIFRKMVLMGVNLKPTDFKKNIYDLLVHEYDKTKDPLVKMMLEQPDIELEELRNIATPTLIIAGQNDIYYKKSFKDMAKAMQNAVLKIIPGHDHGSYIVEQDILYTDLKEFLR